MSFFFFFKLKLKTTHWIVINMYEHGRRIQMFDKLRLNTLPMALAPTTHTDPVILNSAVFED